MRVRNVILLGVLAIAGCSCEDDIVNPCVEIPELCPQMVDVTVEVASTTPQTGIAGTPVADAPAIRITASNNQPVSCFLQFDVEAGGGQVWHAPLLAGPSAFMSAGAGVTRLSGWRLGPAPGLNRVRVSTVSCTNPVLANVTIRSGTFEATAIANSPAEIIKVEGDQQTAAAGSTASPAPRVRVLGAQSVPLANTTVTFGVIAGSGTVGGATTATVTTDADGYATAPPWVFGTGVGFQYLQASVTGLAPVIFEATTTAAAPRQVVAVSTPAGSPGQQASPNPVVRVTDAFGNPAAGVTVQFEVTAGGGTVASSTVTTDAAGAATGNWTFGPTAGLNTLVATVLVGGQPDPQVQGNPVSFDVTTVSGGTIEVSITHYGDGLPGITVSVSGTASRQGVSDINGLATFANLPPGPYTVSIPAVPGLSFTSTVQQVTVNVNQTVTVGFEAFGESAVRPERGQADGSVPAERSTPEIRTGG